MHGRLKVKEKAEIELEKKKKHQEKAARFKCGQDLCLKSKANHDYNKEAMRITWDLVAINPDAYSLWNMRKEYLMIMKEKYDRQLKELESKVNRPSVDAIKEECVLQQDSTAECSEVQKDDSNEDMKRESSEAQNEKLSEDVETNCGPLNEKALIDQFQKLCNEELELTEYALLKNSKSYSAWQHRLWILSLIPKPNFEREFKLNEAYLQKDGRNLHCWHYRTNLCNISGRAIEDEIKFSLDRIKDNLSAFSYSTLYYRSLILTKASNLGLIDFSKCWSDEYTLVENALFTEPNDQALWFYLRWLLLTNFGHSLTLEQPTEATLTKVVFNKQSKLLIFYFNKVIKVFPFVKVSIANVSLDSICIDRKKLQTVEHKPSVLWFVGLEDVSNVSEIHLDADKLKLKNLKNYQLWTDDSPCRSTMQMKIHDEKLESLLTLKQLEPDNKWLNLILSYFENTDQLKILDDLIKLDPLRTNYYEDQKSKIKLEKFVLEPDQTSLDLSNHQLTVLYTPEPFAHLSILNLTGNRIRCLTTNLNSLISLKHLIVDDNLLDRIHRNFTLPNLHSLSLRNNHLNKHSGVHHLVNCSNLQEVDISGNRLSDDDLEELLKKGIKVLSKN